ncbi:MAG: N-6 DNA methylase [Pseudomonadota bacterium]|nr:N-6 DNA methylase [Pseudomonadota bacterium]
MAKRKLTQLAYDALTLEGGLFNAEWLAKVAHLDAPSQKSDDYGIPAGLNLRDEIARAWRIAQALWIKFHASRSAATGGSAATEKFVVALLESFGFAGLAKQTPARAIGERSFPISHALHRIPVLVAVHTEGLDEGQQRFGEAGRRRSPFGLLQEFLNAADESLWGLVCNGLKLRLVRDNASLTRPAWLEADLERIFTEERFADFSALWLTIHVSRFGAADGAPTDCALETWRESGQLAGTRAREELRKGVERALLEFGQGFLSEASNTDLRAALVSGALTPTAYFQQLLRLVYRLIFLLTVEERGLLHPPGSDPRSQSLYERGYSLRRLRERAVGHSAHDTHRDLYASLTVTFRGLAAGESRLALPALGGLFAAEQTPVLDAAQLQNRYLLSALWALAWIARDGATERVNWRDMGPEELGSVYESLLELVPQVGEGASSFQFAGGQETRGNARKLSGSYYTPDSLVQALLDSALEPVIAQKKAERPDDEARAILSITVIDPAVGSGHFLLSAARRLAVHLARVRAQGQPGAAEHRRALRDVVSHCLFGVDRNPMALELAKIALWLEAMTPEAPLSFLDTHLALGDALLGVLDPACLVQGVPDDAYKPLAGDDKDVCARLKQRNKDARKTLERLSGKGSQQMFGFATNTVAAALAELDSLPDNTLEQISAKRLAYESIRKQQQQSGLAEDLLLAAYLIPKQSATEAVVPTSEHVLCALTGQPVDAAVADATLNIAREHHVFHWRDAFAQVFARGGFDCVLGNPPWETMSPDGKEFFSAYDPQVRFMAPDEQAEAFARLLENPGIERDWSSYTRKLYIDTQFYRTSGRYSMWAPGNLGKGDLNVYRMFVETALHVVRSGGYAAQFVPEGLYNGANAAAIRQSLFQSFRLIRLVGFENSKGIWFPDIDTRAKFCLYVAHKGGPTSDFIAAFRVNSLARLSHALSDSALKVPTSLVAEFSPDAKAVMEFASQLEIDICRTMYARYPRFGERIAGAPNRMYMREVDMGTDRALLSEDSSGLPVFEGRMIDTYDYRAKGYRSGRGRAAEWVDLAFGDPTKSVQPQWCVKADVVPDKLADRVWQYRIGFCDVASPTNSRSLVAALIPAGAVCGHKVPTVAFENGDAGDLLLWLGTANALCMDFLVRKKIALTMSYTVMDSLPFPRGWHTIPDAPRICERVFRLACAGDEMNDFRKTFHEQYPSSRQLHPCEEPDERAQLMAEINVLVARSLFGLTRDQMRYILDPTDVVGEDCGVETFRALRNGEMRQHGEYRTRRLVLEAWDALDVGRPTVAPARRASPYARYEATGIPCCEAEDWLAGVICDAAAISGPVSESALRLLLSASAPLPNSLSALHSEWLSTERLDRLPQVFRWLRGQLGLPATADIIIADQGKLAQILGDSRTEQLARLLVDADRAEQAAMGAVERDSATVADPNASAASKRA